MVDWLRDWSIAQSIDWLAFQAQKRLGRNSSLMGWKELKQWNRRQAICLHRSDDNNFNNAGRKPLLLIIFLILVVGTSCWIYWISMKKKNCQWWTGPVFLKSWNERLTLCWFYMNDPESFSWPWMRVLDYKAWLYELVSLSEPQTAESVAAWTFHSPNTRLWFKRLIISGHQQCLWTSCLIRWSQTLTKSTLKTANCAIVSLISICSCWPHSPLHRGNKISSTLKII